MLIILLMMNNKLLGGLLVLLPGLASLPSAAELLLSHCLCFKKNIDISAWFSEFWGWFLSIFEFTEAFTWAQHTHHIVKVHIHTQVGLESSENVIQLQLYVPTYSLLIKPWNWNCVLQQVIFDSVFVRLFFKSNLWLTSICNLITCRGLLGYN